MLKKEKLPFQIKNPQNVRDRNFTVQGVHNVGKSFDNSFDSSLLPFLKVKGVFEGVHCPLKSYKMQKQKMNYKFTFPGIENNRYNSQSVEGRPKAELSRNDLSGPDALHPINII